jgi:hypothetical protein
MLKEEEAAAAKAITGHLPVAVHAGIVTATVLWSRRRQVSGLFGHFASIDPLQQLSSSLLILPLALLQIPRATLS